MDGWGWLEPRTTEELWARQFGGFNGGNGGNGDGDDDAGNRNGTDGRPWFGNGTSGGGGGGRFSGGRGNNFGFQAAKSIRTSTIILSVFNVIAAVATTIGILWDSYATAKRNKEERRVGKSVDQV